MNADRKLRFGLVGAGAIAQTYVQAFRRSQLAEVAAVADVRLEAAQAVGEALRCPGFAQHEEMAARTPLDACVVCTPPATHPQLCTDLLGRGLHVLCEKPLAVDAASARGMIAAAEAAGVTLMMASKFRYAEDMVRAKSLVASGLIGNVVLIENSFTAFVDMSARWNSVPTISGGGVLIDNGTHSLDILRYFLGPLAELQVMEGKRIQSLPVEDTVLMFVRSASGVLGSIDVSWSIGNKQPDYLRIHGSQGTILVGWQESKYQRSSDRDWTAFGGGYDKVQAFCSQLDNFCRTVRREEAPLITTDDALASVQVVETAYRALRHSTWHPIAHVGAATPEAISCAGVSS